MRFLFLLALCFATLSLTSRPVFSQSETKSFGVIEGTDYESLHIDAYKVAKLKDGKRVTNKQIKVTIVKRFHVDDNYTETFLLEKDYTSLYKGLGELVVLSNKWKNRLLEEDSKLINIKEDEAMNKSIKVVDKESKIYSVYISLSLDKSGYIFFTYNEDNNFFLTSPAQLRRFRGYLESAVAWLDKPVSSKNP